MKHFSICLLFTLLIASCKRDDAIYIPGKINVHIESKATAGQFFELCNGYSLAIKQMRDFEYSSAHGADSLYVITAYIMTSPYMREAKARGRTLPALDGSGKVKIKIYLLNMDVANQADFLNLLDRWEFTDLNVGTKLATLAVPTGEEEYWCDVLSKSSLVRSAAKIQFKVE